MGDEQLVACARQGDRAAFGRLLTRHWDAASGVCLRLLAGNHDAMEDVLQETAVVALVSLDRLREPDRFGAWLCGIALNVARRRMRDARREHPVSVLSDEIIDGGPGPAEHAESAYLGRQVRDAIAHLPNGQRDAVLLFYLQGLTHREVADELDISINAVKARLHQARESLGPALAPFHGRKEAIMTTGPEWIDVQISDVRRGEDDQQRAPVGKPHVVVLTDTASDRHLPIWIGGFEATALATTLDSVEMPRPQTYQFAANLLSATGWRTQEVRVTDLAVGTFYSQVVLERSGETLMIDARPSDALNLAVLADVPIRVDTTLFDNPAATRYTEWRSYPSNAAQLAEEVRQTNQAVAQWLQSLSQDADDPDAD
ncbi:MAG: bifunctional nuclease domain-containing protein [Acidimicrobiia bacterium]